MYIWVVVGLFVFLIGGCELYDFIAEKKKNERLLFKKNLFTLSKKSMFSRLRDAFPKAYIFPNVPYGALFDAKKKNTKEKAKLALRFQGCHVDFVLCDETLTPFCLIKFDETPEEKKKLKKLTSEEVFAEAGYQFVRYKAGRIPSVENLKKDISVI